MKQYLNIDNRTLVEECIRGDHDALNLLYTRFAPKMLGVIHRYVPNADDAEDILHDGFIIAYTRLGSLRDFSRVDIWLATIMRNLSLQFLNSQDVVTILHDIPDIPDTPEINDIINIETLEQLISQLPDGYQKVFRLAVLENKSHKEIGKLLGIAPNSSSSQLFHARLMLRKLISDYKKQTGLLSALLAAITCSMLLLMRYDLENDGDATTDRNGATSRTFLNSGMACEQFKSSGRSAHGRSSSPQPIADTPASSDSNASDPQAEILADLTSSPATSCEAEKDSKNTADRNTSCPTTESGENGAYRDSIPFIRDFSADTYVPVEIYNSNSGNHGWSLALGVNSGILNFNNPSGDSDVASKPDPGVDDPDNPSDGNDKILRYRPTARSARSIRDYSYVPHHNHLPLSFSLTFSRNLHRAISIESGLTYTYLHTSFESRQSESICHWHYIGIPVKLNIRTFSTGRLKGYASLGARFDIPLYSRATATGINGEPDLWSGRFNSPAVWSISASYGLSLKISDKVDLFVEPSLQYRFEHNAVVPNIWSDHPWGFSLPVGIRLNW